MNTDTRLTMGRRCLAFDMEDRPDTCLETETNIELVVYT